MKELVAIEDVTGSRWKESNDLYHPQIRVLDLKEAIAGGWLEEVNSPKRLGHIKSSFDKDLLKLSEEAPNITLNVEGVMPRKIELWLWVMFALGLQSTGLLFLALASYHWHWSKSSLPVKQYAYPCFYFGPSKRSPSKILRILRIQRACTVSDQSFSPYLLFNSIGNKTIRTSRLEPTHISRFR